MRESESGVQHSQVRQEQRTPIAMVAVPQVEMATPRDTATAAATVAPCSLTLHPDSPNEAAEADRREFMARKRRKKKKKKKMRNARRAAM